MVHYKWNDTRLKEVYDAAKSYLALIENLLKLFEEMKSNKDILKNGSKENFIAAAKARAKKIGITKEHHGAKYSFKLWDDVRIRRFTSAVREVVREKKHLKTLLKEFPELASTNIVYYTIQTFIPGGMKGIKDSIAASGSIELDRMRDTLSEDEQSVLEKLIVFLETKRVMRVSEAGEVIKDVDKNKLRGMLAKLSGMGFFVNIPGEYHLFFVNTENFYKPDELLKLIPVYEQDRIANILSMGDITVRRLAQQLYGQETVSNAFLSTYLENFIQRGLLMFDYDEMEYVLTQQGKEFGVDAQSIKTRDAVKLENKLMVRSEERVKLFRSTKEVVDAVQQDLENKAVNQVDITQYLPKDGFSFLVLSEILFGNQFTDVKLLEDILTKVHPTFAITSGWVQGTFTARNVKRRLELVQEKKLHKIGPQLSATNKFIEKLGKVTSGPVCVVQGDDDFRIAEDYADLAQLSEGKTWRFGVNMTSLSAELKRRLSIQEYQNKLKIQAEVILPYQYRIRRSIKNAKEVFKAIGILKTEYRLIIEILIAKKFNFPYPEIYEKVVNVKALFGDLDKNIATPNALILNVGDRIIQFVHNTNFSDVTQYADPLLTSEKIMRHLSARDYDHLPWMLIDGHQEFFYCTYFQNHWVMTTPGMQNALRAAMHQQKVITYRILQSKSLRQNTFRKSPATPGAIEIGISTEGGIEKDGRIRFRLLNDKILKVIDQEKQKPHRKEVVAVLTDLQFGSITMQPELVVKYLDYALYTRGATRLRGNGDWIQGVIYPNFFAENRPIRLVSVDSQSRFTTEMLLPSLVNAPNLSDVAFWQGNHEWNIWGNSITGENALYFFESALQAYNRCLVDVGRKPKFSTAQTVSRIAFARTRNPKGDRVLFPYFAETVCGFKVAYTHMWQPHGGGRTPVDQPRRWIVNMGYAAGDIDMLVGGDKHSLWMAQEAGKILLQMPAAASQSGYELARGLMSTVMFVLLEFDNREGITMEFIPWQFLENYKFVGKLYKGKDELFKVPDENSHEYSIGKYSPFVENKIDELTYYKKM